MADERDREQGGEIIVASTLLAKGFVQVPVVVLQDPDLTAGAKLAYGGLLWYAWRQVGFPGQDVVGKDFGMSARSVRAHLGELVNRGYLSVKRHGQGRPSTYTVLCPWEANPDRQNLPVKSGKVRRSRAAKSAGPSVVLQDVKDEEEQQQGAVGEGTAVVVPSPSASTADGDDLTARIAALGVSPSRIAGLLEAHAPDRVSAWVLEVETLCRSNGKSPGNPAGLLVTALREGWDVPQAEQRKRGAAENDRRRLTIATAEARVYLPDVDRARGAVLEQWPAEKWPDLWTQVEGELMAAGVLT